MTLHLHGVGHFHPENEITNRFLEELDIGTSEAWILERVGIRVRRTTLPLDYIRQTRNRDVRQGAEAAVYKNAGLAKRAAELAMQRAGIAPEQIGLVISGSNAPDVLCPAEACFVARELGIEAPAFDLNSACSSFLVQLQTLSMMDPAKLPDFVLLVAVDSLTRSVDYADRATAVLFGDAAAAAVLSPRAPGPARILHAQCATSPAGAEKVVVERTGHFRQDGRAVQMFAIKRTREGYEKIQEAVAEEGGDAGAVHFIGHQANLRVLEQVCRRCGIPPERHHANVELFGNTGSASAPSVLSMGWEKWRSGDDVALVAVGGGLTWGRALVRFGGES